MDIKPENRIKESEIIFEGDEIILNSEGIHKTVTDAFKDIPEDVMLGIKGTFYRKTNGVIKPIGSGDATVVPVTKQFGAGVKTDLLTPSMSLEELFKTEFPKARWVVDQLFESGTINMISAPPNKWKSWIVILCAICVASGKELFEKFPTEKQSVMIVNEEDNERLLQERCNMLMEQLEALPIYFHVGKQIKLVDTFTDKLIKEAKEKNITLIIFDSLRSVHSADENSSQAMQEIMDQLKKITKEGITILFTHHNRKKFRGGKSNDSSGEESRGSSAINAGIHGHLSCEEEERDDGKYLVLYQQKLKAGPKIDPFEIFIKIDTEKNKFSFLYNGGYKKEEKKINEVKEVIMDTFLKNDKGYSVKDFKEMDIGGETIIRFVLKMLVAQGMLQTKSLNDAQKEQLSVEGKDGKHNTKIYFKTSTHSIDESSDLDKF